MILILYTLRKVFKNQSIILVLLLLVCICQKLIKLLELENNISVRLIILYLIINIPELGKLLIPFSLFLSVMITYYQLHIHHEILAMYACGISKYTFIYSILLCSIIVSCIAFVNLFWLCPYCVQYQDNILYKVKKNVFLNICIDKKFQRFFDKRLILFVDEIHNKQLRNVFIANKKQNGYDSTVSVITADHGTIQNDFDNFQLIALNKGIYYEIHSNKNVYTDVCVTSFVQHQILIDCNSIFSKNINKSIDYMSMIQLWNSPLLEAYIEFNWRLTLLVSIFVMPIIALLLMINVSNQYLLSFLLAVFLYVSFFFSHILLRSSYMLFSINSVIWIWLINFIYLTIICFLNFRNKFLKIFEKYF